MEKIMSTYVSGNYKGKVFQGKIISSQATPFNTQMHKIRLDFWITVKGQIIENLMLSDTELFEVVNSNGIRA